MSSVDLRDVAFRDLIAEMLRRLGEDPEREGLRRTPERVEKSLQWLTRGYNLSVEKVVGQGIFEEDHENMVMVRDIEMYSLCEHHMLPFFGKVHIAYIPDGRIMGLSKLPRIVEVFARRLQVQERMTTRSRRRCTFRPQGRGRGDRGVPPLHDDAGRGEAELEDDHECDAGRLPGGSSHARGVLAAGDGAWARRLRKGCWRGGRRW